MIDKALTAGDAQRCVLFVGPSPVFVHVDAYAEAHSLNGAVEEWVRNDAVGLRTERGADLELGRVGLSRSCRQGHLTTRDGKGVDDGASRGLPEPVTDLVVERLDFGRLDDVRVITQTVKQLRS